MDIRDTVPIPQPRGYPLIGNITDIDPELPIDSLCNLADQYGEIYSLTIVGERRIFVSTVKLMNEICDEKRFGKNIKAALSQLRNGVGDGLFTAFTHEKNWELAHRILVPAFGPLNLKTMFDDMKDIASQLVLKFARYGSSYRIPAAEDFTRLTLDTLALCAMDYRFNSFYTEEQHPFINAMLGFLKGGQARSRRPAYLAPFYRAEDAQFFKDIEYMRHLSDEVVNNRLAHPKDSKDLLDAMINGKDPKTGEKLSHQTIIDNMITFLIAGHETTSGLLSFLFYYMLKSPDAYRKAQAEVDAVIGKGSIQYEHLSKIPYITAMLRETLRLQPTAPAYTISAKKAEGEVVGGKYHVGHDEAIVAVLHRIQRDPAVYGEDANEWKPERMLDENFNKLPPNAWKPFGNGVRGCIGRPFAWQEALMATAMVLQYFDISQDDPSYDLRIKASLTLKPRDFYMRASLREGWTATKIEKSLSGSIRGDDSSKAHPAGLQEVTKQGKPLTILYGSNSGTCEAFAQTLAADAGSHGFTATKVDTLDSAKSSLPTGQPVVIITASYEGEPCDNAAHFYNWLSNLKDDEKLETQYAVFGAGHSDWKQTFHRIPNAIDSMLEKHGSKRICKRGNADAAQGDMMSDFQTWEDQTFWPAMQKQFGGADTDQKAEALSLGQSLSIEVSNRRASHLRADVSEAKVVATRTLTAPGVPEKRHIEIQLPTDATYRSGDYLAILPLNPAPLVHRVAIRFGLPWDAMLTISSKTGTSLPTEHPIPAHSLFSAYLELSQPATKRNVAMLVEAAKDGKTKQQLQELMGDNFAGEVTSKRVSFLDLLERYPAIDLPLSAFVASLITMRVRQYSISSSPLANPNVVTLTYSILDAPSMSGQGRYMGVASTYLSQLKPGDIVHVAVKPSNQAFHLPTDADKTPVIMIAAGTGLAPFRGFIQERAAQTAAGRKLAPAHFYIGCRHPDKDELYRDELNLWEKLGAVRLHHAFSQAPEFSDGHKHVDDALRADKMTLNELWDGGARVYVCGSKGIGESVKKVCIEMMQENCKAKGEEASDERAQKWFDKIRNERYSTDVFD